MKIEKRNGKYHILIPIEYGYEETVVDSILELIAILEANNEI